MLSLPQTANPTNNLELAKSQALILSSPYQKTASLRTKRMPFGGSCRPRTARNRTNRQLRKTAFDSRNSQHSGMRRMRTNIDWRSISSTRQLSSMWRAITTQRIHSFLILRGRKSIFRIIVPLPLFEERLLHTSLLVTGSLKHPVARHRNLLRANWLPC